MNRKLTLGIALALFGAGVLVGQFGTTNSNAQAPATPDPAMAGCLSQQASMTLSYLNDLRKGETPQVISLMETHMDIHISRLGESLSALPAAERKSESLLVIKEFKAYRQKYPHQNPSSRINEGIAKAYKLLD